MNTNKELDQIVHDWLEDRVAEPQPDGLNRALERLDATPQNRRRFLGWWFHKPPDHHSRRNRLMFSATGIIGAIAVLALAANLASSPSQDQAPAAGAGATHIVAADGSGDFSTIGEAVDAAAEGDTILVKPGTYTEAIVIDKDITISGDGPREDIIVEAQQESSLLPDCVPVPFTDTNGCVFVLDQTDTTISGLTFRGDWAGIDIIGGEPTIQGVVFDHVGSPFRSGLPGKGIPIALTEASRAHIIESEFINSADFGIFGLSSPTVEDNIFSGGTQIWAWVPGDDTVIRNNQISGTYAHAIVVAAPTTMLIEGNTISGAGADGILVGFGGLSPGVDPIIRGNTIIDNTGTGISVVEASNPTIEDNIIARNRLGIGVRRADPVVAGNELTDNITGILVRDGAPSLEGNIVTGGNVGLELPTSGSTPTLLGNTICDNETNLRLRDGAEMPDIEGNEICEDAPAG